MRDTERVGPGKVVEINEALSSSPEAINQDPFGEGWLFVVEPSDESELGGLLDAAAYRDLLPDA